MSVPVVPEPSRPVVEPARDPYLVYLDSLTSPESRRAMRGCLDRLAALVSGGQATGGEGQPWHLLRYEHTVRLRALMTERGWSPAYVNKHLVALRRVLREAWRLSRPRSRQPGEAREIHAWC
ncbi:integrase, partial [Streptosporangium saharense]